MEEEEEEENEYDRNSPQVPKCHSIGSITKDIRKFLETERSISLASTSDSDPKTPPIVPSISSSIGSFQSFKRELLTGIDWKRRANVTKTNFKSFILMQTEHQRKMGYD